MMLRNLLAGLVIILLSSAGNAGAQYIFLDTNDDGVRSVADALSGSGSTNVDVWLRTDANRDGSRAASAVGSSIPLSIFSYEFVLRAINGTVEWGDYRNLQPTMSTKLGEHRSAAEFYVGFFGDAPGLPPGRYKLGTLAVRVISGAPRLQFTSMSSEFYGAQTSFGSPNSGMNGWNTLVFVEDSDAVPPGTLGAWGDADGVGVPPASMAGKSSVPIVEYHFGASLAPNPLNPGTAFTVTTTRPGFLRIMLFDVSGRLVKTLADEKDAGAGVHRVRLTSSAGARRTLASGVYFYRVEAEEGVLSGRMVVAK